MRDAERKKQLRRAAREARRDRPTAADDGLRLARAALTCEPLAQADCLAAFLPLTGEPDSTELIDAALRRGQRVLLPSFDPAAPTEVGWVDLTTVGCAGTGLADPSHGPRLDAATLAAAEVVLVPALAVDEAGTRLGQGGGWYDRALRHARPDALLLAVVHADEVWPAGELPREPHDVPLHGWLTTAGCRLVPPRAADRT